MGFSPNKSLLEQTSEEYRSGFVALIGRPNVGKSTLLNKLLGQKIAITSPIAQTTRNRLRAILTTKNSQLIIVDTPGIHKPHHLLGERLVKSARSALGEVDLVLFLVEANKPPGRGDEFIFRLLQNQNIPVLVVLNKWDLVSTPKQMEAERAYRDLLVGESWKMHRCSAKSGNGCDVLLRDLTDLVPKGPQLYPPDMISDQPERVLFSELIREQVLLHTREEIPHSVAVIIDKVEDIQSKSTSKKSVSRTGILATVVVERKSQKGILIGKGGSMLKMIGKGARLQIQNLIDGPIYLELFVKVIPDWRSKPGKLAEMGYKDE